MGIPRFFKTIEYNKFEYKPLYYDPDKEEREQRNATIKRELGIKEEGEYVPNIKGQMQRMITQKRSEQKDSNVRLILIFAFLSALAYWIFYM